uniref:Uncharacterized protein LOC114328858 n=1 Tax=Diabrotica virgifera virgifera TaxID=50390 RepID=A0A6P7FL12_DIAVI
MSRELGKVEFLRAIRARKYILFGKFSPTLTKTLKSEHWGEVRKIALAMGLINENKQYTYCRDVLLQNLRKRAVEKLDNARKTGTGGGAIAKKTEIDLLVYEILGKDSSVLNGTEETVAEMETIPKCVHYFIL